MTPIASNTEYAKITQDLNELSAAKGKIQTRLKEIGIQLNSTSPDADEGHVAAALQFAATGKVVRPVAGPAELQEESILLRKQSDSIEGAIRDKHVVLNKLQGDLSVKANAEIEAKHKKLAAQYLETLKQLDKIAEEELEMIQALERSGYSVRLREYIRWPHIGLMREASGAAIWGKVRELSYYASK